jgi:hypothetical protein
MKREEIFQTICRCTEVPDSEMHRALYAYAVKRKFPSTEVIYNKLSEMCGQDLPPTPKFDELTEATKVKLTIFRGVAELLEPFADESIEVSQIDGAGKIGEKMPEPVSSGQTDGDGSAQMPSADMQASENASLGKPGIDTQPVADLTGDAAPDAPTATVAGTSDGTTLTPPDVDEDAGFEQPHVGDTDLTKANPRKK